MMMPNQRQAAVTVLNERKIQKIEIISLEFLYLPLEAKYASGKKPKYLHRTFSANILSKLLFI